MGFFLSLLVRAFLLRFRPKWVRSSSSLDIFADPRWLRKLILSPASLDVRVKMAELIRIFCERSEAARSALIPALINVIASTHLGNPFKNYLLLTFSNCF